MIGLYCVNCHKPLIVDIDDIDKGQFVTCPDCKEKFNVFRVYEYLYKTIPLAKELVDILARHVHGQIVIEDRQADVKKAVSFMVASGFQNLLKQVVFDTVLFGNSFIEKVSNQKQVTFKRIDPTTVEVKTVFQRRPPFRAYYEEIEKLIQYVPATRDIKREDFVHFIGQSGIHRPLGLSTLGFWFHSWYHIHFQPSSPLRQYVEGGVIQAANVPIFYIYPTIQIPKILKQQAEWHFQTGVKRRRERIARVIQEEIFPIALGRPYSFRNYPKFLLDDGRYIIKRPNQH